MNKEKTLLVYTNFSSFVEKDYNILKKKYTVEKYHFPIQSKPRIIILFIKQFCWLIFNIHKYSKVYIWFADYHSLLPILISKIFSKKSYLVIGGYDVCRIKDIGYGSFKNKIRGFCAITSIKNANYNIAVSKYIERKIKAIAKNANTLIIYNSVDTNLKQQNGIIKENSILTVGIINSIQRIKLKGIDTFVELAKNTPDFKFIIVGANKELLENYFNDIPKNLEIVEFSNSEELNYYYSKAKIYCQFSRIESFCISLAEAILHNCTPLVFNTGALKEIVSNSESLSINNINTLSEKIHFFIDNYNEKDSSPRKSIIEKFSNEIREEKLINLLK